MNNILLIYNEVPEDLRIYQLDGLSRSDYNMLKSLHGIYINGNSTEEHDKHVETLMLKLNGEWSGNLIYSDREGDDKGVVTLVDHFEVVVTGFIL